MISCITNGVEISVLTGYDERQSNPYDNYYFFTYTITIKNNNPYTVQLMSRVWHIFDSVGSYGTVEGEGVVGVQPVLLPDESYTYTSGCGLQSELGKMEGYYSMQVLDADNEFTVKIPTFQLVFPGKWN